MKYIYKINGTKAELINQAESFDKLHTQETYPALEYHENTHAILSYNEEQGIHWEYIPFTNAELRERAYETEKLVNFENEILTVDEANKKWQEYQAEGNTKATELTVLISAAKNRIREQYPDEK